MVFEKIKSNFSVSNNFAAVCQEKYCKSHHNQILQTMKKNMRVSKQQSFGESFHSYENINGYHKRKIVWFVHYWEKSAQPRRQAFMQSVPNYSCLKKAFFRKPSLSKNLLLFEKNCAEKLLVGMQLSEATTLTNHLWFSTKNWLIKYDCSNHNQKNWVNYFSL